MRNLKLTLSYEGTDFLGWQKTNAGLSVEEALSKALSMLLREKIVLQAASRTDRGVHAKGQVVNFFTEQKDTSSLVFRLNQVLPKAITVLSLEEKEASFHPTLDCVSKEYHYRISHRKIQFPFDRLFSWHIPGPLNLEKLQEAIPYFVGEKDFTSLCNQKVKNPICHIFDIQVKRGEELLISIKGNRFLYKMVRNIVGTLVFYAKGKMSFEEMKTLLDKKDRTEAGPTAPAHGLYLYKVNYT